MFRNVYEKSKLSIIQSSSFLEPRNHLTFNFQLLILSLVEFSFDKRSQFIRVNFGPEIFNHLSFPIEQEFRKIPLNVPNFLSFVILLHVLVKITGVDSVDFHFREHGKLHIKLLFNKFNNFIFRPRLLRSKLITREPKNLQPLGMVLLIHFGQGCVVGFGEPSLTSDINNKETLGLVETVEVDHFASDILHTDIEEVHHRYQDITQNILQYFAVYFYQNKYQCYLFLFLQQVMKLDLYSCACSISIQNQSNINRQMMNEQSTLPPFSLYPMGSSSSKCCFESLSLTVLCSIIGPYFDRNNLSLEPTFNISIAGSSLSPEDVCTLGKKIQSVIAQSVVSEKYLRMNFDIVFHVVDCKQPDQLLPGLINLLCFTTVLAGVQIKSMFTCAQVWLAEQKIYWQKSTIPQHQTPKKMCMVLESSQKQLLYSQFEGQFIFVHFQRLGNLLMDANEQIQSYMVKKIGEINDQFQN